MSKVSPEFRPEFRQGRTAAPNEVAFEETSYSLGRHRFLLFLRVTRRNHRRSRACSTLRTFSAYVARQIITARLAPFHGTRCSAPTSQIPNKCDADHDEQWDCKIELDSELAHRMDGERVHEGTWIRARQCICTPIHASTAPKSGNALRVEPLRGSVRHHGCKARIQ